MTDNTDWKAITDFFNGVIDRAEAPIDDDSSDLIVTVYSPAEKGTSVQVVVPRRYVNRFMENLPLFDAKIWRAGDERTDYAPLKEFEDYETYVHRRRNAMDLPSWTKEEPEHRTGDRYYPKSSSRLSHWKVGDTVILSDVEYQIGHVRDAIHMWTLRLDPKYAVSRNASIYVSVPKCATTPIGKQ